MDVILGSDADLLSAYLQACLLARSGELTSGAGEGTSAKEALVILDMLREEGWQVGHAQLATLGWSQCKDESK